MPPEIAETTQIIALLREIRDLLKEIALEQLRQHEES
jgi:hypothetical protein